MKIYCAPATDTSRQSDHLRVVLYGLSELDEEATAGGALARAVRQRRLIADRTAWDLLSLALGVLTADLAGHRKRSPDGWTREFAIQVAVSDPSRWTNERKRVESLLAFLTTDRWRVEFLPSGFTGHPVRHPVALDAECVALLSGGLDSLVGILDLRAEGRNVLAVSHVDRGDGVKQASFALKSGAQHLPLNHTVKVPDPEKPPSQRARSFMFIAYAALAATTLSRYRQGHRVDCLLCENGFIGVNAPLTDARLGSLSTRTAHPTFLLGMQDLFDAVGLRLDLRNPYATKTKGEMLEDCRSQALLGDLASESTSCGRFKVFGYNHCGRCVPCQIRRAAFVRWGRDDATTYIYRTLGKNDEQFARFDDVRSVAMAIRAARSKGVRRWAGNALVGVERARLPALTAVLERGLAELAVLHDRERVR